MLVEECGVTLMEFEGYNEELCDSPLQPGQYVYCSEGTLPDHSLRPDNDDNSYVYSVEAGDNHRTIPAACALTVDDFDNYDNNT